MKNLVTHRRHSSFRVGSYDRHLKHRLRALTYMQSWKERTRLVLSELGNVYDQFGFLKRMEDTALD
jgi:hypothetical protein